MKNTTLSILGLPALALVVTLAQAASGGLVSRVAALEQEIRKHDLAFKRLGILACLKEVADGNMTSTTRWSSAGFSAAHSTIGPGIALQEGILALAPGRYFITASVPFYATGRPMCRLVVMEGGQTRTVAGTDGWTGVAGEINQEFTRLEVSAVITVGVGGASVDLQRRASRQYASGFCVAMPATSPDTAEAGDVSLQHPYTVATLEVHGLPE